MILFYCPKLSTQLLTILSFRSNVLMTCLFFHSIISISLYQYETESHVLRNKDQVKTIKNTKLHSFYPFSCCLDGYPLFCIYSNSSSSFPPLFILLHLLDFKSCLLKKKHLAKKMFLNKKRTLFIN